MINLVPLSPLTPSGLVQRIASDLDPIRSNSALCYALHLAADAATERLSPGFALEVLRSLAVAAKPDEDAQRIRHILAAVTW